MRPCDRIGHRAEAPARPAHRGQHTRAAALRSGRRAAVAAVPPVWWEAAGVKAAAARRAAAAAAAAPAATVAPLPTRTAPTRTGRLVAAVAAIILPSLIATEATASAVGAPLPPPSLLPPHPCAQKGATRALAAAAGAARPPGTALLPSGRLRREADHWGGRPHGRRLVADPPSTGVGALGGRGPLLETLRWDGPAGGAVWGGLAWQRLLRGAPPGHHRQCRRGVGGPRHRRGVAVAACPVCRAARRRGGGPPRARSAAAAWGRCSVMAL